MTGVQTCALPIYPSFATTSFYDLARRHGAAIVYAQADEFPAIDEPTADFTYARLMTSREDLETGIADQDLQDIAKQARSWARRGDVFMYFIAGAKERNPTVAQALIHTLGSSGR